MAEHPSAKPPVAIYVAVVNPQSDREGMGHMAAAHECTVGCVGKHSLHLILGLSGGLHVHAAGAFQAVALLLLALCGRGCLAIAREQSLHLGVGIGQCRDDSLAGGVGLLRGWLVVVQFLDATVQGLALQQVAGGGACSQAKCHCSQCERV